MFLGRATRSGPGKRCSARVGYYIQVEVSRYAFRMDVHVFDWVDIEYTIDRIWIIKIVTEH